MWDRRLRRDRRGALSGFAALCALAAGLCAGPAFALEAAPPGYYADQKVVYQNDGGAPDDTTYFRRLLAYLHNHVQAVGRDHVDIRVVDHGLGVDLFVVAKGDQGLVERIDALEAQGVRFLICANTLRERKIDWYDLHDVREDDIVPSGVAELARCRAWASSTSTPDAGSCAQDRLSDRLSGYTPTGQRHETFESLYTGRFRACDAAAAGGLG